MGESYDNSHSTMYLLKPGKMKEEEKLKIYSHSTMYLLKPSAK